MSKRPGRVLTYNKLKRESPLFIMLIPGVVLLFIYNYLPMYGVVMAFQKFSPAAGLFGPQKWIGLKNFQIMFSNMFALRAMRNTVIIALLKIVTIMLVPITVSVLLNEVRSTAFKRSVQTAIYLPYFLSWVVVGSLVFMFFAPESGVLSQLCVQLTGNPIKIMMDPKTFRWLLVFSDIWKGVGWGTIVYMAALSGIDAELYEAAHIDGANRPQQVFYITIPCLMPTIMTMLVLRMGGILNAGFDQIFVLQNDLVYRVSEVIDTYVYRISFSQGQYAVGTAADLFQSVIGLIFVVTANKISSLFDQEVL